MAINLQAVVALDSSQFTGGLSGMSAAVANFSGAAMTAFGGVAGSYAAMYASFGTMGVIVQSFKDAISVGIGFEQGIANVAAVSGLAGEELDRVAVAARNVAKETRFTATETTDALYALAAAGINTADGLESTLQPAILLAGATMTSTAVATEAMTATLAQFGLDASQATEVANNFAGAVSSSPANMTRLAYAMTYAGTAGAAFGMQLSQVVTEVAAFHKVGLTGTQAGTSFRMALIQLAEAAEDSSSVVGAALQGWSASQEGLTGAIERFEERGVSAEAVIQELGARAGPGMAALLKLGSDAIEDLGKQIKSVSNVQAMYDTQINTTSGQWEIFKSGVEEVGQRLFTTLEPALRKIIASLIETADTAASVVGTIGDFIRAHETLAKAIGMVITIIAGGAGLRVAISSLAAVAVATGKSLSTLFAPLLVNTYEANVALTAVATKTMPMVATAATGLTTALGLTEGSFFRLNAEMYKSVNAAALMSGAVAKSQLTLQQANALTQSTSVKLGSMNTLVAAATVAWAGWQIGTWVREATPVGDILDGWTDSIIKWLTGVDTSNEANERELAILKQKNEAYKKEQEELAKATEAAEKAAAAAKKKADADYEAATAARNHDLALNIIATTSREVAEAHDEMARSLMTGVTDAAASQRALEAYGAAAKELETALRESGYGSDAARAATTKLEEALAGLRNQLEANSQAVAQFNASEAMVATVLTETTASAEDARRAVKDLGDGALEAVMRSNQLGISFREAADDIAWLSQNTAVASDALTTRFAALIPDVDAALEQFGRHVLDVARYAEQNGVSMTEAAAALNIYGRTAEDVKPKADSLSGSFAKLAPEVLQLGQALSRLGDARLDEIWKAIEEFARKLAMLPTDINLGWLNNIADLKLSAPTSYEIKKMVEAVKELGKAVSDAGDGLDTKWLDAISNFQVPRQITERRANEIATALTIIAKAFGDAGDAKVDTGWLANLAALENVPTGLKLENFGKGIADMIVRIQGAGVPDFSWADKLTSINETNLQTLETISGLLAGMPTGSFDLSVLIGWEANATLASIDSSLKTLAGLKGVIWA